MNENNSNFIPDSPNFKHLIRMSFQGLTNFPYIEEDFDALTNYEFLSKVVEYLNEVISNNNEQNDLMTALYNAYVSLQNYVNDYFENLDVQENINIKLEEMAADGTLTSLIESYVTPYITAQNERINEQDEEISIIRNLVNSAVSTTPKVVDSIDDMTDHNKIYVNATNGYWYYYSNNTWTQGGLYQSSVDGTDTTYFKQFIDSLNNDTILNYPITFTEGYRLTQGQGTPYAQGGWCYSNYLTFDGKNHFRFYGLNSTTDSQAIMCFYKKDFTYIRYTSLDGIANKINLISYPEETYYIRFCYKISDIPDIAAVYATTKLLANERINKLEIYENKLDYVNVFNQNITTNVNIGETVSLTPSNVTDYKYIILDCNEYESFDIKGQGGNNPRLWAFLDEDNKLITKSNFTGDNTVEELSIIAPQGAKKLVCNFYFPEGLDQWLSYHLYRMSEANLYINRYGYDLTQRINVTGQNINTNVNFGQRVNLTPENVPHWKYLILDCHDGDSFVIKGTGGNNPRLWAFIDSSNKLITKSASVISGTYIITAPAGSSKLICNFQDQNEYFLFNKNDLSLNILNKRLNANDIKTTINGYSLQTDSPVTSGCSFIRGLKTGKQLSNYLTDFKKSTDTMVHVGTFKIINDIVYVTYYASNTSTVEDPTKQIVRFVKAPLNNLNNKDYYDILNVGDTFDNKTVTAIYDTILMCVDNENVNIMWTCALNGVYTRLYQVYNIPNDSFGNIQYNYFKVGNNREIFNTTNMKSLLESNNIEHKPITVDIGIMQKITPHVENDVTWYYTGCYAGEFNCIIKSTDLITWYYVSAPTFIDDSVFENACYVKNDYVYYFIRQQNKYNYGLLSRYSINDNTWDTPSKIPDCQSRSDFIEWNNELYLIHANTSRSHITFTFIDTLYLTFNSDRIDAFVQNSFYPFADYYNNQLYMIYTHNRQNMYFSTFDMGVNDEYILEDIYNRLY